MGFSILSYSLLCHSQVRNSKRGSSSCYYPPWLLVDKRRQVLDSDSFYPSFLTNTISGPDHFWLIKTFFLPLKSYTSLSYTCPRFSASLTSALPPHMNHERSFKVAFLTAASSILTVHRRGFYSTQSTEHRILPCQARSVVDSQLHSVTFDREERDK